MSFVLSYHIIIVVVIIMLSIILTITTGIIFHVIISILILLHWLPLPFARRVVSCCALIRSHVFALGFCVSQPRALSSLCFETGGNRPSRLLHRQLAPLICRRHHRRAWQLEDLLVGWDHCPAVLFSLLHRQMETLGTVSVLAGSLQRFHRHPRSASAARQLRRFHRHLHGTRRRGQ